MGDNCYGLCNFRRETAIGSVRALEIVGGVAVVWYSSTLVLRYVANKHAGWYVSHVLVALYSSFQL